jgi:putative methionine-R-sulfoxide reductase with GAF domain
VTGPRAERDYAPIARAVAAAIKPGMVRRECMAAIVNVLWEHLHATGVSWIGFYTREPGADEMLLGPRRDKPACSPIGLHGACGRSCLERTSLVVTNVARLGEGYIACDPRDLSEVVVPCLDADGGCWGVLDADSFDEASFSERDARELAAILDASGLTDGAYRAPVAVI